MAPKESRGVRRVTPPVVTGDSRTRPLLPTDQRAAQPAPWVDPLDVVLGTIENVPHDHHVRLTERHCARVLRSIGWVFIAGTSVQAPHLIRPRRLDHLGGC